MFQMEEAKDSVREIQRLVSRWDEHIRPGMSQQISSFMNAGHSSPHTTHTAGQRTKTELKPNILLYFVKTVKRNNDLISTQHC